MRSTTKPKFRPEDVNAALDDYKREQDEKIAWNATPVMDLPRGRNSMQPANSNLADALSRVLNKKK